MSDLKEPKDYLEYVFSTCEADCEGNACPVGTGGKGCFKAFEQIKSILTRLDDKELVQKCFDKNASESLRKGKYKSRVLYLRFPELETLLQSFISEIKGNQQG